MKDFENTFNLGNVDNFRSLKGYAGQELAFGRLMLCGFNVQRNLWRDAKYDGTFVVKEVPVKIEIKSSTRRGPEYLNEFDCTSGSRAGGQIDRNAPSRTKLINMMLILSSAFQTMMLIVGFFLLRLLKLLKGQNGKKIT